MNNLMLFFLFLELLFFLLMLAIIGDPLRHFLKKLNLTWLSNNDTIQKFALDIAFGGLIVYFIVLALTPLHLFNREIVWIITLSFVSFQVYLRRKSLTGLFRREESPLSQLGLIRNKLQIAVMASISTIFAISLLYRLAPLQSVILGSVHDNALHSLFVQLMIENKGIPPTLDPYLPQILRFPQGMHVLFTYMVYLHGYMSPKAVLYVTALFNTLTIFGGYYFGKAVSDGKLGISLAFILGLVAPYPITVTWGGNTIPFGIFLYLLITGIFYKCFLFHEETSVKRSYLHLIPVGFLLGYLGTVHVAIFVIAITTMFFIGARAILVKNDRLKIVTTVFKKQILILLLSLIPISIWLYRLLFVPTILPENFDYHSMYEKVVYNRSYFHGRLFPANIIFHPLRHFEIYRIWYGWYMELGWPACNLFLTLLTLSPFFLLRAFYVNRARFRSMAFSSIPFFSVLFWALNTPHGLFYLTDEPFILMTAEADKMMLFLAIAFSIFVSYTLVFLYELFAGLANKIKIRSKYGKIRKFLTNTVIFIPIIAVVALTLLAVPNGVSWLKSNYDVFSITTAYDYELMLWMRDNLPRDAIVLINPYESGTFIPSISQHRVIFPWTGSPRPPSYEKILNLMQQCILNATTYDFMRRFNATHVYVGSKATYQWMGNTKWDPTLFLGNPNFKLVKNVGNAYLFKFSPVGS